jgi:hypothetical protein
MKDATINYKDFDPWKKKPALRAVPIKIRAYIYQCRDLPASDENGATDAYVTVWDLSEAEKSNALIKFDTENEGDSMKKTRVIEDNLNPLFYECLELEYEVRDINDLNSYPPFIIDVWD